MGRRKGWISREKDGQEERGVDQWREGNLL